MTTTKKFTNTLNHSNKSSSKSQTQTLDIFDDFTHSLAALQAHRNLSLTQETKSLVNTTVALRPSPSVNTMSAQDVLNIRKHLKLSRNKFANCLQINPRTLENWEQDRAVPNAQAVALLLLVAHYPDTIERLKAIFQP